MVNKRTFTEEEIAYLKLNYATTKNKYILAHLGITRGVLARVRDELGLKKIPNYREIFGKVMTKYGDGRAKNRPSDEAIKKSHERHAILRSDDEHSARRYERASASHRAVINAEKRRILFGLPQKTKRKIIAAPKAKVGCRYRLRKHGYIVDYDADVAYYTDTTSRVSKTEETAKKYGIKIKEYEKNII